MGLVRNQPVGYPAAGFLYPNPFLSYNESVADGVAELMRLILVNAGSSASVGTVRAPRWWCARCA